MNGVNSAAQIAERRAIDAKHGVSSDGFWRNMTRLASVLDGSWSKRRVDSRRLRGLKVSELRVGEWKFESKYQNRSPNGIARD